MTTTNWRHRVILIAGLLLANAAQATVLENKDVDWGRSLLFATAGGLENPLVRVGFNPQPEPPAGGVLSFGKPPNPAYPPDPIITHSGDFGAGTPFRLLFGIASGMELTIPTSAVENGPDRSSLFNFDVLDVTGARIFDVQLEMTTTSGGLAIDWVAFNPQPEPPALGDGAMFGADLSFSSFSDVSLAIRIYDAAGTPLTLRAVPEPGIVLLTVSAIGLMSLTRPRRRRD